MIKRILKEPLFHFAVLGLGLFIVFALVSPVERNNEIVIDQYDLNEIVAKWNLQWQRDPTPQELKALLDQYIKEEIFYREALSMNLDHNDEIIRRRLAQKMKFLSQDIAEQLEPTEGELQQHLEEHQEKYIKGKKISFSQIYFNGDKREDPYTDALEAMKSSLETTGDVISIRSDFNETSLEQIRTELGIDFAISLDSMNVMENSWQGPVKSGYGYHLVIIKHIIPARKQTLEEVRGKVFDDYQYDRLNKFNEDLYKSLLEQYEVTIGP